MSHGNKSVIKYIRLIEFISAILKSSYFRAKNVRCQKINEELSFVTIIHAQSHFHYNGMTR